MVNVTPHSSTAATDLEPPNTINVANLLANPYVAGEAMPSGGANTYRVNRRGGGGTDYWFIGMSSARRILLATGNSQSPSVLRSVVEVWRVDDIGTARDGDPGPQGPQGDRGPAGPAGPQGEAGPVGIGEPLGNLIATFNMNAVTIPSGAGQLVLNQTHIASVDLGTHWTGLLTVLQPGNAYIRVPVNPLQQGDVGIAVVGEVDGAEFSRGWLPWRTLENEGGGEEDSKTHVDLSDKCRIDMHITWRRISSRYVEPWISLTLDDHPFDNIIPENSKIKIHAWTSRGLKGEPGDAGPSGGQKGDQGPPGPQGPSGGQKGDKGDQADSLYMNSSFVSGMTSLVRDSWVDVGEMTVRAGETTGSLAFWFEGTADRTAGTGTLSVRVLRDGVSLRSETDEVEVSSAAEHEQIAVIFTDTPEIATDTVYKVQVTHSSTNLVGTVHATEFLAIGGYATSKGQKGEAGEDGADSTVPGPAGPTGPIGPMGGQGNAGPQGMVGEKGQKGDTGADSTVAGPRGEKGDDGTPGLKGETGAQGDMGIQGIKGEKGARTTPPREITASGNDYTLTATENLIYVEAGTTGNTFPQTILREELSSNVKRYILDSRNPQSLSSDGDDRKMGFLASINGNVVTLDASGFVGTISKVYGLVTGSEGPIGPKGEIGPSGGEKGDKGDRGPESSLGSDLIGSVSIDVTTAWHAYLTGITIPSDEDYPWLLLNVGTISGTSQGAGHGISAEWIWVRTSDLLGLGASPSTNDSFVGESRRLVIREATSGHINDILYLARTGTNELLFGSSTVDTNPSPLTVRGITGGTKGDQGDIGPEGPEGPEGPIGPPGVTNTETPTNIGTSVVEIPKDTWASFALTEPLEDDREYMAIVQRGSDSSAVVATPCFYGAQVPENAGGSFSTSAEPNQLGLAVGRIEGGGAIAISIAKDDSDNTNLFVRCFLNNAYRLKELIKVPPRSGPKGDPGEPGSQAPAPTAFTRHAWYFTWQVSTNANAPGFIGATWAAGEFSNIPAGWVTERGMDVAGSSLWQAFVVADGDGNVTATVSRVVEGFTHRYSANNNGPWVTTFVNGTHNYAQTRNPDGTWGAVIPLSGTALEETDFSWTALYTGTATFGGGVTTATLSPTADLDDWAEIKVRIRTHGPDGNWNRTTETQSVSVSEIRNLVAHNSTTFSDVGSTLSVATGGTGNNRVNQLAVGNLQSGGAWGQYDGAQFIIVLRREDGAAADSRVIGSIAVSRRTGHFNDSSIHNLTVTILGR